MAARRARATGAGAPPAHQRAGQGLRRDPGRHADHQGREQHQRRTGHLQRARAGEEPVAGRRRVRVRRRRQPDPAEDPALPRRAVALPDLQHRLPPGAAHGCHRRGLHPAAAGPRHHLPGRLLPAKRGEPLVRAEHAGHALPAQHPIAQRRGRALRVLRARERAHGAVQVQPDRARPAAAHHRPRPCAHGRRAHRHLRGREQRSLARAPHAGLAHALRLGRLRGAPAAARQLPGPHRQCRAGQRHLGPVQRAQGNRGHRGLAAALRAPDRRSAPPVRALPLAGRAAAQGRARDPAGHRRHG